MGGADGTRNHPIHASTSAISDAVDGSGTNATATLSMS